MRGERVQHNYFHRFWIYFQATSVFSVNIYYNFGNLSIHFLIILGFLKLYCKFTLSLITFEETYTKTHSLGGGRGGGKKRAKNSMPQVMHDLFTFSCYQNVTKNVFFDTKTMRSHKGPGTSLSRVFSDQGWHNEYLSWNNERPKCCVPHNQSLLDARVIRNSLWPNPLNVGETLKGWALTFLTRGFGLSKNCQSRLGLPFLTKV